MESLDNDELEQLFHADLQSLYTQRKPGEESTTGNGLPEWIIGVIVVVILLVAVFFAMVIYSLVKEKKKQWAGSYGAGRPVSGKICDEIGKDDSNIQITSFTVDSRKPNGDPWVDTQAPTLEKRTQVEAMGCLNRAFVGDGGQESNNTVDKTISMSTPTIKITDTEVVEISAENGEIQKAEVREQTTVVPTDKTELGGNTIECVNLQEVDLEKEEAKTKTELTQAE